MPSPFPGMDPFLELRWGDVHTSLAVYARDQLQQQLPSDLRARVEERMILEIQSPDETRRSHRRPDVQVVERSRTGLVSSETKSLATDVALAEPRIIRLDDPLTQRCVQIVEVKTDRVVTVIEFLSPTNKLTLSERNDFQQRQQVLLDAGANLVEIDLIRRGGWVVAVPEEAVPREEREPYRVVVVRAETPREFEYYHLPLARRLPAIRVPLRPDDADIRLDLQPLLDQAWENADYSDLAYEMAECPPFPDDDREWIKSLLNDLQTRQQPGKQDS